MEDTSTTAGSELHHISSGEQQTEDGAHEAHIVETVLDPEQLLLHMPPRLTVPQLARLLWLPAYEWTFCAEIEQYSEETVCAHCIVAHQRVCIVLRGCAW